MMNERFLGDFGNGKVDFAFGREGGGFPTSIHLHYPDSVREISCSSASYLTITLADGRTFHSCADGDCQTHYSENGYPRGDLQYCQRFHVEHLSFSDDKGQRLPQACLNLRYELYDDGTLFIQTHFILEDLENPPAIAGFALTVPLELSAYQQVMVPYGFEANMTESVKHDDSSRHFAGIKPAFNWLGKAADGRGGYFEVFMEDAAALDGKPEHRETILTETATGKIMTWNFQTEPAEIYHRNVWEQLLQWGMFFAAPPVSRRNPPFQMYHWLDAFECRIPSRKQVEQIAQAGAEVIVLHEVWRSDVSRMAFPYDHNALKRFIGAAHANGLRVALYIRGVDELTTAEDACDWFHSYLKPDWDGLYADFGGVLNTVPPYHFKKHYLNYLRIRKTIGRFGLFYAHLGCLSSAVGLGPEIVDGYVSGEGEMGTLGQGRFLHEALSGSYISTGTFWSAAFPEYGREEIIPFLAATGQYPHSPLGVQHRSTSLAHPLVPGINDTVFRKLWKLWKPMKDSKNLLVFNDFNGTDKVTANNSQCGCYLMVDTGTRSALLLVCNFSREIQHCRCQIDWPAISSKKMSGGCFQLIPHTGKSCDALKLANPSDLDCTLGPSGYTGFYFGWERNLRKCGYFVDYPELSDQARKYLKQMAEQKALREPASQPGKVYCRVSLPLPQIPCICIEPFYSAYHELGTLDEAGEFHSLGYVTREGMQQNPPAEEQWLWCNTASPWICLNDLQPEGGIMTFAVRTYALQLKCYFHSFVEIEVAKGEPSEKKADKLSFMNGVEYDRSMVHFTVNLQGRRS